MQAVDQVELLRRQYFQLQDPEQLALPSMELLRLPEVQAKIHKMMFDDSKLAHLPSDRYRFRVLKRLVSAMEQAAVDPEEDEISDDLSACLAHFMAQNLPAASTEAQKKGYVMYTLPALTLDAGHITLLEAPSLLGSIGTTGFRTWEAALFLGTYLTSPAGRNLISGKNIIELGAGTGFLSILCAKHLNARHVLATDGSREVVTDIKTNLDLNGLGEAEQIQAGVLQWGHTLINGLPDSHDTDIAYDVAIGADVTYDINTIPSLIATLRELFGLLPNISAIISATVRNEQTLACFIEASLANGFTLEQLEISTSIKEEQLGFFFPTVIPIRVYVVTHNGVARDPFAL